MANFFSSPEFKFLKKLREHLEGLNTENNYNKYRKHLNLCRKVCKSKYGNIGWRQDLEDYGWAVYDENKFGRRMVCLGGFDELSFYPGHTIYMAEDLKSMALKDENGKIIRYTEEETDEIRNCSIYELQKIHKIKIKFEGDILSGEEKRKHFTGQNKKTSKYIK